MKRYSIAIIPGDGIGREVVPAALVVLAKAADLFKFELEYQEFPWGCDYYKATGNMMAADGLERLRRFDAILLGAVGAPGVADHVSLWGLLIPIRRTFQQYVNLRPIRLLEGIEGPLKRDPHQIDFIVVRENIEGEYSEIGGRMYRGTPQEMAIQESVFTRTGVERILRYASQVARSRKGILTAATKSNGIIHTMPLWDEICREVADAHGVDLALQHIDALAGSFVLHPERLDVVVASNLFGDILSDLGSALAGSIGIAPSANLNPEREYPSMFEPIHGSAPDIAGKGIANPIGQIWAVVMMLEHLGEHGAADHVMAAVEGVLRDTDIRTPDIGGSSSTEEFAEAVVVRL